MCIIATLHCSIRQHFVWHPRRQLSALSLCVLGSDGGTVYAERPGGIGARHRISGALFLGAAVCYAQRVGLPIAIVRMQPQFGWDREEQGGLMSAFYLGCACVLACAAASACLCCRLRVLAADNLVYTCTDMLLQIPGALLAQRIGASRAIGLAVFGSSMLSALVPWAARGSISGVYLVRLGQGLCQGCLFPSVATIWSRWAPPAERSRLAAFPQVGGFVGTLLFESLGGWQCDHRCDPDREPCSLLLFAFGGWEGVFILHAVLGVAWLMLWVRVGHDSPELHPRLAAAEAAYLRHACPAKSAGASMNRSLARQIVTSAPVLAICCANTANNFGDYVLMDGLPSFFRDVLGFSLTTAGLLASMPQIAILTTTFVSSWLADGLIRRPGSTGRCSRLSTLGVRRLFSFLGLAPSAFLLALIGTGVVTSPTAAVICFTVAYGAMGLTQGGGYAVNYLDIAPAHAGFAMGCMNTFGQAAGWFAPWILGQLTPYPQGMSREDWSAAQCAPPRTSDAEIMIVQCSE